MASGTEGSGASGSGRDTGLRPVNRAAPLTIRLKEPAGSAMQHDVRLHVDSVSGTVEERLARVVTCLSARSEWRSLSDADRRQLESKLGDWLPRNLDALTPGTLSPEGGGSGARFDYQMSDPWRPEAEVPPPREAPPAPPPVPGRLDRLGPGARK